MYLGASWIRQLVDDRWHSGVVVFTVRTNSDSMISNRMSVSRLRRNVGECARHHRLTIVFVLTIISLATVAGECCEEESETWSEDHPFGVFQQIWNCSTMGLRVGESAPPLPGITWTGTRSVVSFVTLASPPDQLAMVRSWSSFAGLQVVVIVVPRDEIDVGMSIAEFGNPELVLTGAVAGAAAHAFRVGYEPCPVTLLVGEDGVVAFRRRGRRSMRCGVSAGCREFRRWRRASDRCCYGACAVVR